MIAKTVNESLKNILRPKSQEEIAQALEQLKYGSFKLSSYLNLEAVKDDKFLRFICKENNINIAQMEISKLGGDPLAQMVDDLFIQKGYKEYVKFYEFDSDKIAGTEYDSWRAEYVPYYKQFTYEYSKKHNVIRCITTDYFVFPEKQLKNILIDNILNN